ncbi:MAG: hypothetical protein H7832_09760 [Magnetococcus sp. DMHC-6]
MALNGDITKLLILDRPGYFRVLIQNLLKSQSDMTIRVLGNHHPLSKEALLEFQPNVLLLTIDSVSVDVIRLTRTILDFYPCPIILIHGLANSNCSQIIDAMATPWQNGAVDCFPLSILSSEMDTERLRQELSTCIRLWSRRGLPPYFTHFYQNATWLQNTHPPPLKDKTPIDLTIIASAIGGLGILPQLLKQIGPRPWPIVINQKINDGLSLEYIHHLKNKSGLQILSGESGQILLPETVILIPSEFCGIIRRDEQGFLRLHFQYQSGCHTPMGVDFLFQSASENAHHPIGIVLTGFGSEGEQGAASFFKKGFPLLVQNPTTCLADELPKRAIQHNPDALCMTISQIANYLTEAA